MNSSPLLADPDVLSLERIDLSGETVALEVSARRPSVPCPGCRQSSSNVHSYYQRIPQDLPWQGVAVKLKVQATKPMQLQVVDLLPDRTAATFTTFSAWLKAHPGVEVVSRDRSSDYTLAAKEAAPEAVQVADRWHLFKNLGDVLEAWLGRHRSYLTEEVTVDLGDENTTERLAATWQLNPKQAETHKARRVERIAQFGKATLMRKQGFSSEAIVNKVGISTRTLRRWSTLTTLPERKKSGGRRSISDPYKPHLEKRWREGCEKPKTLWREITDQGFSGSAILVSNYLIYLRNSASEPQTAAPTSAPQKRYLPREAARLFTCSENDLGKVGKTRLQRLLETCPDALHCYNLAQRFAEMLRKRDPQPFGIWLKEAFTSGVTELRCFANGIPSSLTHRASVKTTNLKRKRQ